MRKSAKVRADIAKKIGEMEAMLDAATIANRELTEAEAAALAALQTAVAELESALGAAEEEEAAEEPVEEMPAETPAATVARLRRPTASIPIQQSRPKAFAVPKNQASKAFRGHDRDRDAYVSGQFIRATMLGSESAQRWCREHGVPIVRDALSTGANTAGGFLVPQEFESAIIVLRDEYGALRQAYGSAWPMGSDNVAVPKRSTGVTAYFVGDNQEITSSDPAWGNVELTAKKMGCLTRFSSEVNEDAVISLADILAQEFALAFATKEDQVAFIGDGTSAYGGMRGLKNALAAGSKYTAASGNTAFSTLDLADFEGMVGKLPSYALGRAAWHIHRAGWAASMMRLADAAGGITAKEVADGPNQTQFLGFPVIFNLVTNSTLTAQTSTDGLCYFGDLSMAAAFGERRGITIQSSADRYFELDQIGIKATQRVALSVHDTGTASVAGAMLMLSTPGS